MNEIRIRIECTVDKDHAKILRLDAARGAIYAKELAELVCGTSPIYIHKPATLREPTGRNPIAVFGECAVCRAKLGYTIETLVDSGARVEDPIWEFDEYVLRAASEADLPLAASWTHADEAHRELDPAFWLEQTPAKQSYLLFDNDGPVFFFKGVLTGRVLEVFVQFPPHAVGDDLALRFEQKFRVAKALARGTEWLETRMRGVVEEFVFETLSPSLKHFCEHRLGFEEHDGRLRKALTAEIRD